MPDWYFLLDADFFHRRLLPELASAWREKSFLPCQTLCRELLPAIDELRADYYLGPEETLVNKVARGMPFVPHVWSALVSEVLLIAARETPELRLAVDTLGDLLGTGPLDSAARDHFPPIAQALFGSRDLVFGHKYYRPDNAGWNDVADAERLARFLNTVNPYTWAIEDMRSFAGPANEEERMEELGLAREGLVHLQDLYQRAAARKHVVVSERT